MRQYTRLFFLFSLLVSCLHATKKAEDRKITAMDESLAPNVYVSDTRFLFEGVIIPILRRDNTFLIFDLEIMRSKEDTYKQQQENKIPIIIDALIADLTPTLETFWDGRIQGLQDSLNKSILRVLRIKAPWVESVRVSNLRMQQPK